MTSFTFSHAEADDWAGLAKSLADGLKAGAGNGGGDDRLPHPRSGRPGLFGRLGLRGTHSISIRVQ